MNKEKISEICSKINRLAEELELVTVAYKRIGEDRGSDLTLVLGGYWKLPVCRQNSSATRGIDMIVLGLQKHLTGRADSLKDQIKRLQVEFDKEIEGGL